jgi:response regulator NasT
MSSSIDPHRLGAVLRKPALIRPCCRNREAELKLNERKVVERAKGILMQLRDMNEAEAYHAMRKMAMDRNIRIIDVAQKLGDENCWHNRFPAHRLCKNPVSLSG